ncbi:MAG TPA: hypothetical protein VL738_43240 [Dactylosporangium sp.]|jgi:hypothetical protein|nr:hypothetical protein [Dactylosporangium sp.]
MSEYAKTMAGRWMDRTFLPPVEMPATIPQPVEAALVDDAVPFSTPRAARTLLKGERVLVGGEWQEITEHPLPFVLRDDWTGQAWPCMRLTLACGVVLEPRYEALLVSRDEDEQAQAAAHTATTGEIDRGTK